MALTMGYATGTAISVSAAVSIMLFSRWGSVWPMNNPTPNTANSYTNIDNMAHSKMEKNPRRRHA